MRGPINWQNRITPSKMAAGAPVTQLGSTEAVLAALPAGGVLFAADMEAVRRAEQLLAASGRPKGEITISPAAQASYIEYIGHFPKETPIGVDVGAFDRVMPSVYRAAYAQLRRFQTVHWG